MPDDRCDLLCLDLEKAERLRHERLDPVRATRLAEQARAVADPTRLIIAAALAGADELCVCDLAWVAERAENLVSPPPSRAALARAGRQPARRQDGALSAH